MKLERLSPELGSEAFGKDFKAEDFYNKNESGSEESGSILDMVEGMKDEHVSEAPNRPFESGIDQAPEGLNSLVLEFRTLLQSADLSNQTEIDELNSLIDQVASIDESQAETLKEEFVAKKIE